MDFDFPDRSAEQVDAIGFDCRAGSIKEMEIFHDRMLTEKSPFERMMEVGEQFLPRRVLWGLLPEALLLVFFFKCQVSQGFRFSSRPREGSVFFSQTCQLLDEFAFLQVGGLQLLSRKRTSTSDYPWISCKRSLAIWRE